jgi:biopolymer transport protein ExbB
MENLISHFSLLTSHFTASSDYLDQGGYVIYPLMIVSVWMWYLIVKKLAVLAYWRKQRRGISQEGEAHEIKKAYQEQRTFDLKHDRRLLQSLVQSRQNDLERHVHTIFVLASVAPLLGLLGTVTGMISTFEAICRFGTANARAFAAGISEALITTQIGLIVAIPGLFMGHLIRRRTDRIQNRLERWKLDPDSRI